MALINKKGVSYAVALALAGMASAAHADTFVNGDFETGNMNGWTIGGGSRTSVYNNTYAPIMTPSMLLPGGSLYNAGIANSHSAIVSAGTVDPRVGAAFGTTVYSGNYSLRVEDTTSGGYASVAAQTVANYTDPSIFFAWKAVLLGAHSNYDAATILITLKDITAGDTLVTRQYNAADSGTGVDSRFSYQASSNNYYTANWQIEQLDVSSRLGHTFELSVLASDCQPTAHWGYVYLDGFGAVIPPTTPNAPEPGTLGLAGLGLLSAAISAARRRKQKAA
jgi:hypothetical protein